MQNTDVVALKLRSNPVSGSHQLNCEISEANYEDGFESEGEEENGEQCVDEVEDEDEDEDEDEIDEAPENEKSLRGNLGQQIDAKTCKRVLTRNKITKRQRTLYVCKYTGCNKVFNKSSNFIVH